MIDLRLFQLICLVLLVVCSAARAENLAGADTPEFEKAVKVWLAGEDATALDLLATLSREGHSAAQILLANIALRGHLHAHVTSSLSRKERVALLRVPKGLSGKSWLTEAQNVEPLAVAMLQAREIGVKAAAIQALIELGEPIAGIMAAQTMLYHGDAEAVVNVLEGLDGQLPDEAVVVLSDAITQLNRSRGKPSVGSGRVRSLRSLEDAFLRAEVAWVPPSPRQLVDDNEVRISVARVAESVRSWTPMKNFCQANCPESVATCTMVGASALWSAGPFAMRSPVESLISNESYWNSQRAEADMIRQIQDVSLWSDWPDYTEMNACFFDAASQTQREYGFAKY